MLFVNNVSLFFTLTKLKNVHLTKDLIEVPRYISKITRSKLTVYATPEESFVGQDLNIVNSSRVSLIRHIFYLKKQKGKIFCMFLHLTKTTFCQIFFVRLLIPNSQIYLKLDMDPSFFEYKPSFFARLSGKLVLSMVNVISAEDKNTYFRLLTEGLFEKKIGDKLIHLPNGTWVDRNANCKKENKLLVLSRFYSKQKNTELLFKLFENVESFCEFEIVLAGPIEDRIDEFHNKVNALKNRLNIRYMGNINDRQLLTKLLSESKAIINTSLYEGFALVFPEAVACGTTIISTDVNGFKETTNNYKFGHLIKKYIYDETEAKQLDAYLIQLIESDDSLFEHVSEWAGRNFSWDAILNDKVIKILTGRVNAISSYGG